MLPASASWCEAEGTVTNSERRVQRVRRALDPPGQARDDIEIVCELAARLGHDWGQPHRRAGLGRAAVALADARRHELPPARRGGRLQWPCWDEEHPGEQFLHGRLWDEPVTGPPAPFNVVVHELPVDELSDEFPIRLDHRPPARLVQHRRPERRLLLAASTRRVARPLARGLRAARRRGGRAGPRSRRGAARSSRRCGSTPRCGPGLAFMTLHFPDEVETNVLTIDATDPEVRHGRVQGERDPRREALRRRAPHEAVSQLAVPAVAGSPAGRCAAARRPSVRPSTASSARRARRGRARPAEPTGTSRAAVTPRGRSATCSCRCCTSCRPGRLDQRAGALGYVCRRLTIPPAEAYGVASFYALFALEPRPPRVAHVCTDIACMCRGGTELVEELERTVGPAGEPSAERHIDLAREPLPRHVRAGPGGARRLRPAKHASEHEIGAGPRGRVAAALAGADSPDPSARARAAGRRAGLRLLRRIGHVDPASLDSYRNAGGYAALRRALEIGPAGVIREVTDSKLLGRGGAAFPTGRKWDAVARNPVRPHYLVCNADESEPGTFKDRIVIENDPFALIEALTIAGFATGCEHAYVYLRGEYPLAWERLSAAIDEARGRAGSSATTSWAPGSAFDIELRKGAGAYICGEETALFNSIEGYRGEPRNKPPFPVDSGLFAKPTVVNNVESLINVLDIVLEGGEAFAEIGTERVDRHTPLLPLRLRRAPGALRGAVRRHARRADRDGGRRGRRRDAARGAARRRGRRLRRPRLARSRALVRGHARGGRDARLGRRHGLRRHGRPRADPASDRRLLPRRDLRPVRAVPRRHRPPAGGAPAARVRAAARDRRRRARPARRDRPGDARRVDLRPRADGRERVESAIRVLGVFAPEEVA